MDRNSLVGMTTGAAFMFGFGIVWLLIGIFRGGRLAVWLRIALLFAGIALGASIASMGLRASRMPLSRVPLTTRQQSANREIARRFYIIFGAELAAIFLAVLVLNVTRHPEHILCAIALIVGLHFFPLAPLFASPVFYATGSLGCSIGIAGFLVAHDRLRQAVVGVSFGLLLWATAAWITWTGLSIAPRVAF